MYIFFLNLRKYLNFYKEYEITMSVLLIKTVYPLLTLLIIF